MSFKVEIISMGSDGKTETGNPIIREYKTAVEAMKDLHDAIQRKEGRKRVVIDNSQRYTIVMPDGRKLSMVEAYEETFNESPVLQRNVSDLFPRLYSKRQKAK